MARLCISLLVFLAACSWGKSNDLSQTPLVLAENLHINIANGNIHFKLPNIENDAVLNGKFGVSLSKDLEDPKPCTEDPENCLQFHSDLKLTVVKNDRCYHISWFTKLNITLEDCFDYGKDNWYGGPQSDRQYWPFNNMTFKDFSYIPKQERNQAVAEPYWVTSSGYYIYVNTTTPLFIDANNHQNNSFCLIAKQTPPYLPRGGTSLKYKVCAYKNTRKAHMKAIKDDLGHPTDIPDQRMVSHPIWSTWVRDKWNVNETSVRAFANEIINYKFNNSQLEIDDNWETCYGSVQFNKSRFPNMPKLGSDLHEMGFRVTLWNHPFINTDCNLFNDIKEKGYLVKNQNGSVIGDWWDGRAGSVDFTNPSAAKWFLDQHRKMMKHNNIDGLKLDAGESSWLPQMPQLHADISDQPNAYSAAYVRTVAQFGSMVEVRVGHHTQDLPIFVRMIDRDSKWDFDNGMPTLMTAMHQLTLNGYPYVLPDMVGGNAYGTDVMTKELFIRWLQVNTFMPAIQFSVAPWDFDSETVEISRKFTSLHYAYSDKIISLMKECVKSGSPINAPLWWIAPTDPVAHSIWSEYVLGDNMLVAPVMEEGAVSRDIYLPQGKWQDEVDPNNTQYDGPMWLYNYPAPLDTLPYFTRVGKRTEDCDI